MTDEETFGDLFDLLDGKRKRSDINRTMAYMYSFVLTSLLLNLLWCPVSSRAKLLIAVCWVGAGIVSCFFTSTKPSRDSVWVIGMLLLFSPLILVMFVHETIGYWISKKKNE